MRDCMHDVCIRWELLFFRLVTHCQRFPVFHCAKIWMVRWRRIYPIPKFISINDVYCFSKNKSIHSFWQYVSVMLSYVTYILVKKFLVYLKYMKKCCLQVYFQRKCNHFNDINSVNLEIKWIIMDYFQCLLLSILDIPPTLFSLIFVLLY